MSGARADADDAGLAERMTGRLAERLLTLFGVPLLLAAVVGLFGWMKATDRENTDRQITIAGLQQRITAAEARAREDADHFRAALREAVARSEAAHANHERQIGELAGAANAQAQSMVRIATQLEALAGTTNEVKGLVQQRGPAVVTVPAMAPESVPRTARAIDRLPAGAWPNSR